MAENIERPTARRRPRAAADETSDPMDATARPASPQVPASPPTTPRLPPAAEPATEAEPLRAQSTASPTSTAERPAPSSNPVAPRPTSGAYVTLNVRVSIEIDQLLGRAMAETGMTKRAAVEQALIRAYG